METVLTPMTELEAVNDMLSLIKESPVASLTEAAGVADAQVALQLLRRETRAVQETPWYFNTEENYRLAPNNDGEIVLPLNTVSADPTDETLPYIMRAGKLYDTKEHTFNIGKAVYVDLVQYHAFDDLPPAARRYIATLAGRKFQSRLGDSDETDFRITERDVEKAYAVLLADEIEQKDYNVVRDSATARKVKGKYRD